MWRLRGAWLVEPAFFFFYLLLRVACLIAA